MIESNPGRPAVVLNLARARSLLRSRRRLRLVYFCLGRAHAPPLLRLQPLGQDGGAEQIHPPQLLRDRAHLAPPLRASLRTHHPRGVWRVAPHLWDPLPGERPPCLPATLPSSPQVGEGKQRRMDVEWEGGRGRGLGGTDVRAPVWQLQLDWKVGWCDCQRHSSPLPKIYQIDASFIIPGGFSEKTGQLLV